MKLYTYITGPDDETFCRRICERLNNGWELYGHPALTFNGTNVIAGQALIKEVEGKYLPEINLKKM